MEGFIDITALDIIHASNFTQINEYSFQLLYTLQMQCLLRDG